MKADNPRAIEIMGFKTGSQESVAPLLAVVQGRQQTIMGFQPGSQPTEQSQQSPSRSMIMVG